jgi:hypothetical protein
MGDGKWIEFVLRGSSPSGKTERWSVHAKQGGGALGEVKWYPGWRRYCFFPFAGTLYEQDCLRDIAAFCETETATHHSDQPQVRP